MISTLSDPIKELNLDQCERAIMLAVIIFSEELVDLSPSGKEHIRKMSQRFVGMLQQHIKRMNPSLTNAQIAVRIGKMMILLSATTVGRTTLFGTWYPGGYPTFPPLEIIVTVVTLLLWVLKR